MASSAAFRGSISPTRSWSTAMTEAPTQQATPVETKSDTLSSVVGKLAWALSNTVTPGDLAALRRLKPGDPSCLAFWKIVADHLAGAFPERGLFREQAEARWGVVLSAMAELEGLHQPNRPLGRALAEADYSELRLLRLLRAHDEILADSARTMAHFLRSKADRCSQTDIARLIL